MKKTKILVFVPRESSHPSCLFDDETAEQVDEFNFRRVLLHCMEGSSAMNHLCKAAKRAMSGVQRRCQQYIIDHPVLKCKLFANSSIDTLVKPILCFCCEAWSILGAEPAPESMERIQLEFITILLGVQVHTKTLHVLAEFRRYPLHVAWQSHSSPGGACSTERVCICFRPPDICSNWSPSLTLTQYTCKPSLPTQSFTRSYLGSPNFYTGYTASSIDCGNTTRGTHGAAVKTPYMHSQLM